MGSPCSHGDSCSHSWESLWGKPARYLLFLLCDFFSVYLKNKILDHYAGLKVIVMMFLRFYSIALKSYASCHNHEIPSAHHKCSWLRTRAHISRVLAFFPPTYFTWAYKLPMCYLSPRWSVSCDVIMKLRKIKNLSLCWKCVDVFRVQDWGPAPAYSVAKWLWQSHLTPLRLIFIIF